MQTNINSVTVANFEEFRKRFGFELPPPGRFYYRPNLSMDPNTTDYYTVKDNIAYNHRKEPIYSLYIGRIPPDMTESDLRNKFAVFGDIKSIFTINNTHPPMVKRYGFVRYENAESAFAALVDRAKFDFKNRPMFFLPADRQP